MEIVYHAHHAVISERMRQRADAIVRRLAQRLGRVVDVMVRFEGDGPQRRVELVVHRGDGARLIAEGAARYYGPARKQAAGRLQAQLAHRKRTPRARVRDAGGRLARAS